MHRKAAIFWTVLLLATALRFFGMVRLPFDQDEVYTITEATELFQTRIAPGIQARPVFFLLEHPIVTNLPHTEIVMRLLPFLFGFLGLFATWALARRLLGETGALVATLLAAVSPWHLYASTFGRYYSLLYLLATCFYWRLSVAYESDRPRDYVWALLPLLVGAWTHPSFVFPIAGAILAISLIDWGGATRWRWPSRAAWLSLWGPFLVVSVIVWLVIRSTGAASTVANGGDRGLLATLRLLPAMVDWMTPIIFAAAVIGMIAFFTSRLPGRRQFGLMVLLGGGTMFVALFALSFKTAIYADYGIAALPLILVAAAGAVQWIGEAAASRAGMAMTAVAALLVVGVLPSVVSHLSDGTRFDYRPAFARIARDGPNTAVLTWPLVLQRAYAPGLRAYELPSTPARLDSLLTRERDVWAVISVKRYGIVADNQGEIGRWLTDRCRLVDSYQHPRLDYRLYQVNLWRCRLDS